MSHPRWSVPLLLLLLAVGIGLCVSTYNVFGHSWDEPEHIAAGMVLIQRGDYRYDDQHPPLARLASAIGPHLAGARLPQRLANSGVTAGRDILYDAKVGYSRMLTYARLGMLPFLLVLVIATWNWTRRWHGEPAAALAALFAVCTPVIIGHAAVVAVDVAVTGMTMLSLYALVRWLEFPDLRRTLCLGVATALAIASKISAIPFIGVAALALIAMRLAMPRATSPQWHWGRRVPQVLLMLALIAVITVGLYGTSMVHPVQSVNQLFPVGTTHHEEAFRIAMNIRVPLGVEKVIANIMGVIWHNDHGHPSYMLGETSSFGWWYFYPVALAVKTPLPLLILGLSGLMLLAIRGWRERSLYVMAPTVCFVAILLFCCLYSHINIGVRHVLIAYPLLAIGAAVAVVAGWQYTRLAWLRTVVAGLALWQVATMFVVWPDYLAYFNFTAGAHPERILVDSDLDWGQDLRRLERELKRRKIDSISIAYMGSADLKREPLPHYTVLKSGEKTTGWVAIDMLSLKEDKKGYAWLLDYQPVQRVGQSIDLYYIR
ncbi:MAG: glycosyltransferase family 39 protein [Steroidobacteraceae bacterium]